MGTDADIRYIAPTYSGPLVFRGCLDAADIVNINWCVDGLRVRRPVRWLVSGTVTFLAVLAVIGVIATVYAGQDLHPGGIAATVIVLLVWVYLHFILSRERTWQARRFYRQHADKYIESRVTLTQDRVAATSKDGSWEYQWKIVWLVVDVPPGMLFLTTARQMLFWLPERVFDDDMVRQQVLGLCHLHRVQVQTRL